MVNTSELLINVVIGQQAKGAGDFKEIDGLNQKVRGQVQMLEHHLSQMTRHRQRGKT